MLRSYLSAFAFGVCSLVAVVFFVIVDTSAFETPDAGE